MPPSAGERRVKKREKRAAYCRTKEKRKYHLSSKEKRKRILPYDPLGQNRKGKRGEERSR